MKWGVLRTTGYMQKRWWWNINNRIINFHHRGEENTIRWAHMVYIDIVDRTCVHPRCWRWKR